MQDTQLTSPIHVAAFGTHREAVFVAEGSMDDTPTAGDPKKIPTRDKIDPQGTGVSADPASLQRRGRLPRVRLRQLAAVRLGGARERRERLEQRAP